MIKLAFVVAVIFVLGAGAAAVTVEGASPVKIGKKGTAYPVKCGIPLKVWKYCAHFVPKPNMAA